MRWVLPLIGALVAAVALSVGVIAILADDDTSVLELDLGECFDIPLETGTSALDTVALVDCSTPHNAEVVLVGTVNDDRTRGYPADDALFDELDRRCADVVVPGEFGVLPIAPNEKSWEPFAGRFVCVAIPYGGAPAMSSVQAQSVE